MPARRLPALLLTAVVAAVPGRSQEGSPSATQPEVGESQQVLPISRVLVRSEKLASGAKLWLKNRNGDVHVMGWDKEELSLTAEIHDTDQRRVELRIQRKGSDLDIETLFQQPFWTFDWGIVLSPRCEMTVFVPQRLLCDLRTTNGSIEVAYVDGYARCETTNGNLMVKDISGEVHLETKNGNIEGRDLQARLRAVATNGHVTLANVDGGIAAETTNGNITAKGLDGWGEGISLSTTNGSIEFVVGDATGEITAESPDGNLNIRLPDAKVVEVSKHSARLKVSGRMQNIALRTTNGTITIRE
jgi:hypothetical protein